MIKFEDIRHFYLLTIYENNSKVLSCRLAVNESWIQQKILLLRSATIRKMILNYDFDSKRLLNYDSDRESQSIDFERTRSAYNDIYLREWMLDRSRRYENIKKILRTNQQLYDLTFAKQLNVDFIEKIYTSTFI
jgi:hypothetical protein